MKVYIEMNLVPHSLQVVEMVFVELCMTPLFGYNGTCDKIYNKKKFFLRDAHKIMLN
jgi:hypothetical protein